MYIYSLRFKIFVLVIKFYINLFSTSVVNWVNEIEKQDSGELNLNYVEVEKFYFLCHSVLNGRYSQSG